jgi:hypothetical protein
MEAPSLARAVAPTTLRLLRGPAHRPRGTFFSTWHFFLTKRSGVTGKKRGAGEMLEKERTKAYAAPRANCTATYIGLEHPIPDY